MDYIQEAGAMLMMFGQYVIDLLAAHLPQFAMDGINYLTAPSRIGMAWLIAVVAWFAFLGGFLAARWKVWIARYWLLWTPVSIIWFLFMLLFSFAIATGASEDAPSAMFTLTAVAVVAFAGLLCMISTAKMIYRSRLARIVAVHTG